MPRNGLLGDERPGADATLFAGMTVLIRISRYQLATGIESAARRGLAGVVQPSFVSVHPIAEFTPMSIAARSDPSA